MGSSLTPQKIANFQVPLARDQMNKDTLLHAAWDSFLNSTSGDLQPRTKAFYQTNYNLFAAWCAQALARDAIIGDLNSQTVGAFKGWLAAEPTTKYPHGSPFRTRAAVSTLKRLANWLADEGDITARDGRSVLRTVRMPAEPKDVRMPLSEQQFAQLRESAGNPGDQPYTIVVFMAGTGLRLNEARELRIMDLNLKDRFLQVRAATSKRRKGRRVDFHDAVARDLDRYLRRRNGTVPEDPLFPADHKGQYTLGGFEKVFARLSDSSGVAFSAHVLRHTWATNCRLAGMDLLTLKEQGGWARWEQLQRYAHIIPIQDRTTLADPTAKLGATRRGPKVVPLRQEAM